MSRGAGGLVNRTVRLTKNIVPVDPEHQPNIRKFVTDGKRIGVSVNVNEKSANKLIIKKKKKENIKQKPKNECRSVLNSESYITTVGDTSTLSDMMATTTLKPVASPGFTMLQEIKDMEERLKLTMKENCEKERTDMEIKMKTIIENSVKESIQAMITTINNMISTNPMIQVFQCCYKVGPLIKSKDCSIDSNYRPISLLTTRY